MSEVNKNDLEYFISSSKSVFVVVFTGSFSRESIATLQRCQDELLKQSPQQVILVFRDVSTRVELPVLPAIAKFKKAVRDLPAEIRICSLHPDLRSLMESKGLLRVEELDNNINESLQKLRLSGKV